MSFVNRREIKSVLLIIALHSPRNTLYLLSVTDALWSVTDALWGTCIEWWCLTRLWFRGLKGL